jgi:hypothetical protein
MLEREPISAVNIAVHGNASFEWSRVRDALAAPHGPDEPIFLGTVRPDGRPHVVGIGVTWFDGDFYFTSGPETIKSANLAADPRCSLAGSLAQFDVSLDGVAERIVDPEQLAEMAERFRAIDWPATVVGNMLEAAINPDTPTQLWNLYRFRFTKVIALAGDGSAMRFRFAG